MTVCIAAACNNGTRIVTATDGLLSMGEVTSEAVPGKMLWYRDWQFMYAGTPAHFAMVSDEIESVGASDSEALSRSRVLDTVRQAYRKIYSRLASFDSLNPFDMTMEQFKENGLRSFGEAFHTDMLRRIEQKASQLNDQILVTGWARAPHSAMIYEIGPWGDALHTNAGFAAIGSGAQMAQTMLLLLGQARHSTLSETIFNVACAKFSSEKSAGLDVGQWTTMYVSRKRTPEDNPDEICGDFINDVELNGLRRLWDKYLKPRIPDEAWAEITRIAARISGGEVELRDMVHHLRAAQAASSVSSRDPQSPKLDLSGQPPSPE